MPKRGEASRWLQVCRHGVSGFAAPYLLVLQHDLIQTQTRIAAPVVPAGPDPATLLAPRVTVEGVPHKAMLLDMTSLPVAVLGATTASSVDPDAVSDALDAIFRGYPVGVA